MPRIAKIARVVEPADIGVTFALEFDGPALETGRMDAKIFAPALFAAAALVERSAGVLHGLDDALTVQVNADFRRGSFHFDLTAVPGVATSTLSTLSALTATDIVNMLKWVGLRAGEAKNLFRLIAKHGPANIEKIDTTGDGNVHVHIRGNNNKVTIEPMPREVARLLTDPEVRRQAFESLRPLTAEGINVFRAGDKKRPDLSVPKRDYPKFLPPTPTRSQLTDSEGETAVQLLSPSFVDGNKWRMSQGESPFWVTISDRAFLEKVDGGEAFAKGDYFVVQMTTQTFEGPDGIEVSRDITKVVRHIRRPRQPGLFDG